MVYPVSPAVCPGVLGTTPALRKHVGESTLDIGHLLDLLIVNERGYRGALRLDLRCLGVDLHGLLRIADGELQIDGDRVGSAQCHSRANQLFEAGFFRGHTDLPCRERIRNVPPAGIGNQTSSEVGTCIGHCDLRVWNDAPARIGHSADNVTQGLSEYLERRKCKQHGGAHGTSLHG